MRVDRASGYKEAVPRLESHRRFPFFLPYANARQHVKRDCGWMQMSRIDATWFVYRFIDCHFLICGVRHNHPSTEEGAESLRGVLGSLQVLPSSLQRHQSLLSQ